MKSTLLGLLGCGFIALLVSGCQTTDSETSANVWRRPEYYGGPKKSVAVAVLAYRQEVRVRYENALVAALRQRGVNARSTYASIDTQTLVSNRSAAVERAKSLGVDAVLAVRMVDRQTLKAVRFAPGNSGTGLPPWHNWFEFFNVPAAFSTNPEMAQPGQTIGAQATFFECPSGDLLWSATFTRKIGQDPAQANTTATAIVQRLQSAALIP